MTRLEDSKYGKLSKRALRVLKTNDIYTEEDLISFIKTKSLNSLSERGNFQSKNWGLKTIFEIRHFSELLYNNSLSSSSNQIPETLHKHSLKGKLSNRALNSCESNNIYTEEDLKNYVSENGIKGLYGLRNCGDKTVKEITALYKSIITYNEGKFSKTHNPTQKDSSLVGKLSIRALRACSSKNIKTVTELQRYISLNGIEGLTKLRNCGENTIDEITTFYNSIPFVNEDENTKDVSITNIWKDQVMRLLITQSYYSKLHLLSKRTQNLIFTEYGKEPDILQYLRIEIEQNNSKFKFYNVLTKSQREIEWFNQTLQNIIRDLRFNEKLINKDVRILGVELLLNLNTESDAIENHINDGNFSLLDFIEKIFLPNFELDYFDKLYVEDYSQYPLFNLPSDAKKSLQRIHRVSKERIRQLIVRSQSKLPIHFSKLKPILELHNHYKIFLNTDYHYIDLDKIEYYENRVSKLENLRAINLIGIILSKEFYILNHEFKQKRISSINFKNYDSAKIDSELIVIIRSEFLSLNILEEEYEKLIEYLDNERKEEITYEIKNDQINLEQKKFLIDLFVKRFRLKKLGPTSIELSRNKEKSIADFLYEIIYNHGEPLSVDELLYLIESSINTEEDNLNIYKEKILVALRKDSRFIILRGALKSGGSKYGLKIWENKGDLKSGSIVELCRAYLNESEYPVHLLELTREIQKHRDTNQKSIRQNLTSKSSKTKIFEHKGYIGLKNKNYPQDFFERIRKPNVRHSHLILEFLRYESNYNYDALIQKFSRELRLEKIQIEGLLQPRIDDEIVKIEGSNIIYTNTLFDNLVGDIFKIEVHRLTGFNPYSIAVESLKIKCLVKTDFNSQENDFSKIVKDNLYNKDFFVLLSLIESEEAIEVFLISTKKNSANQSSDSNEIILIASETFNMNEVSKISAFLKKYLLKKSNTLDEIDFLRDNIDFNNLSELESLSKIIQIIYDKTAKNISLKEAQAIYQIISNE